MAMTHYTIKKGGCLYPPLLRFKTLVFILEVSYKFVYMFAGHHHIQLDSQNNRWYCLRNYLGLRQGDSILLVDCVI